MECAKGLFSGSDVVFMTVLVRLTLSFLAGGLIGLEREHSRQPAGLRTHMLVCVGATLIMLVSEFGFTDILANGHMSLDPSRIAAQVVSGIGFLGACAVLKIGSSVKGLTTAASIWVTSAVGLAIGSGLLVPAAITIVFMLVAIILFERFERRFFPSEQIKTISLCFGGASIDTQEIRGITERYGIRVRTINVIQEIIKNRVQVDLLVTFPSTIDIPKFYEDLRLLPNIYKIKMDEKF